MEVRLRRGERHITCFDAKDVILRLRRGRDRFIARCYAAPDDISSARRTRVIAEGKHDYANNIRVLSIIERETRNKPRYSRPCIDGTNRLPLLIINIPRSTGDT